jgi:hypothetical protein
VTSCAELDGKPGKMKHTKRMVAALGLLALLSIWAGSNWFPWEDLRGRLPRASLGEVTVFAGTAMLYATSRDRCIDNGQTGLWMVCKLVSAFVLVGMTLGFAIIALLTQD